MKQAITLFLCACALPTALLLPHARSEGVITLKSCLLYTTDAADE